MRRVSRLALVGADRRALLATFLITMPTMAWGQERSRELPAVRSASAANDARPVSGNDPLDPSAGGLQPEAIEPTEGFPDQPGITPAPETPIDEAQTWLSLPVDLASLIPGVDVDGASDAFDPFNAFGEGDGGIAGGMRKHDIALVLPEYILWLFDRDQNARFDFQEQWGLPGDRFPAGEPLAAYSDGYDELVVYRRGDWYVKVNDRHPGFSGRFVVRRFGSTDSRPLLADFNGDGRDEAVTLYQQTNMYGPTPWWTMHIDRNGDLQWNPVYDSKVSLRLNTISADDQVLAGSLGGPYDELAIWRNATGMWELYTTYRGTPTTAVFTTVQFGLPGDLPFLADLNGDGVDDICVFRPSNKIVYVNYYEPSAPQAGYGPNGDVDRMINYATAINAVNTSVGLPNRVWNVAALGVQLD